MSSATCSSSSTPTTLTCSPSRDGRSGTWSGPRLASLRVTTGWAVRRVVCAFAVAGVVLAGSPLATADAPRAVFDGVLRFPLPSGWVGSVGPGWQGTHRVAWILVGDFAFPSDAATHEGTPNVPARKVLITIGDFFATDRAQHWPTVKQLRVPRNPLRQNGRWWHVRFRGRAVVLCVHFGSKPDAATVAGADRVLAAVTHQR